MKILIVIYEQIIYAMLNILMFICFTCNFYIVSRAIHSFFVNSHETYDYMKSHTMFFEESHLRIDPLIGHWNCGIFTSLGAKRRLQMWLINEAPLVDFTTVHLKRWTGAFLMSYTATMSHLIQLLIFAMVNFPHKVQHGLIRMVWIFFKIKCT